MPTKSDLSSARAYLARMAAASAFSRETTEAIELVLAATAEPSEEELLDESVRYSSEYACKYGVPTNPVRAFEAGYFAGARREGRLCPECKNTGKSRGLDGSIVPCGSCGEGIR